MKEPNNPLISVIVPVYKVEQYLDECVQSIIHQTYTNLEIILVDDGSPDRCPEMCDEYAKQDSRIRVIHKKNGGLSSARNAGLEIATGDYIGFVDSDDYIVPEMYETLLNGFVNSYIGVVSGQKYRSLEDLTVETTNHINPGIFASSVFFDKYFSMEHDHLVWNKLYRKDVVGECRFKNGTVCEDFLFYFFVLYYLAQNDLLLNIVPNYVYFYRYNRNGIAANSNNPLLLSSICHLKEINDYCVEKKEGKLAALSFSRYLSHLICFIEKCLENQDWKSKYYKIWNAKLRSDMTFSVWKEWGIRHKILSIVIIYIPFLWRIKIVRLFCTKNGLYPWIK